MPTFGNLLHIGFYSAKQLKPLFFSPNFQPPRKRLRKQQSPLVKEVTDDSFYTKEELAVSKLENHHLFFDDDVPCEANTPLEEDRECCPKCDRKFITYFRYVKFIYSEKATKLCEIFTLFLTGTTLMTVYHCH